MPPAFGGRVRQPWLPYRSGDFFGGHFFYAHKGSYLSGRSPRAKGAEGGAAQPKAAAPLRGVLIPFWNKHRALYWTADSESMSAAEGGTKNTETGEITAIGVVFFISRPVFS